jgi:hypothetical protein
MFIFSGHHLPADSLEDVFAQNLFYCYLAKKVPESGYPFGSASLM